MRVAKEEMEKEANQEVMFQAKMQDMLTVGLNQLVRQKKASVRTKTF